MTESLTIATNQRANSALLVIEIGAQMSTPFSMACGQDDSGYFVRITTDTPLSSSDADIVRSVVAAHDPTLQTAEQIRVAKIASVLADVSIADVRALVDAYDTASTAVQIKAALRPIVVLLLKAAVVSGSIGADQVVDNA